MSMLAQVMLAIPTRLLPLIFARRPSQNMVCGATELDRVNTKRSWLSWVPISADGKTKPI
jgi:hypothetical protein